LTNSRLNFINKVGKPGLKWSSRFSLYKEDIDFDYTYLSDN